MFVQTPGGCMIDRIARVVPAAGWLMHYRRDDLGHDLLAGVVAGAVVIPQAMAYGTIAGLPVQVGLYTCIVPMIAYALLGGSRRMSLSTTSTIVALTGLAITVTGVGDAPAARLEVATTLTLMVGLLLWLARIARLGFLVECVSEAVLVGLKVGVGITIAVDQVPALLGIAGSDGGVFSDVANIFRRLDDITWVTAALSAASLLVLFGIRRVAPRVPGPLVVVVGGILASVLLHLDDHGVDLIPKVPRGLPAPVLPAWEHVGPLMPYALGIALMAYLESVSVARLTRELDDPPLDNGRELVAVGAASVAGSFFQCAPAAGGFSQTLVNSNAGARTQLSELATAALAVLVALVLSPLLSDLPSASLAAIVLVAVVGLIDVSEVRRFARIDRVELLVALVTGGVALVSNLLVGVGVGVLLTFYLVIRALDHPNIVELRRPAGDRQFLPARPDDPPTDGVLVLRVEGGMYTLNVRSITDEVRRRVEEADPRPHVVVFDAAGSADTSVTVIDAFLELDHQLARHGTQLWVAALPQRALEKAVRTPHWSDWADAGRVHRSSEAAVAAYEQLGGVRQ
jgi:high affinity sulfate transporter 1